MHCPLIPLFSFEFFETQMGLYKVQGAPQVLQDLSESLASLWRCHIVWVLWADWVCSAPTCDWWLGRQGGNPLYGSSWACWWMAPHSPEGQRNSPKLQGQCDGKKSVKEAWPIPPPTITRCTVATPSCRQESRINGAWMNCVMSMML